MGEEKEVDGEKGGCEEGNGGVEERGGRSQEQGKGTVFAASREDRSRKQRAALVLAEDGRDPAAG